MAEPESISKTLYEKYFSSHFLSINRPLYGRMSFKDYFEELSRCYKYWYGRFLPADKKASILDVGCGMGHFLYFLVKEGYENILGIDISPEQISFVRKYVTDKVLLCDAMKFLEEVETKFDLIVLNDVLEHMLKHNIPRFLTLAHKALSEDGKIFIKTVNASNPFNFRGRYIDFTHEVAFTEHSLVQVLKVAGFEVISVFGDECPATGLRSSLNNFAKKIFFLLMRKAFCLQGIPPPRILDKNLIAIAAKRKT